LLSAVPTAHGLRLEIAFCHHHHSYTLVVKQDGSAVCANRNELSRRTAKLRKLLYREDAEESESGIGDRPNKSERVGEDDHTRGKDERRE